MNFYENCSVGNEFKQVGERERGLFVQVIQGMSARMVDAVEGTKASLSKEGIEAIRRQEVASWANLEEPTGEAAYLEANPEIAKAGHDCELRIQLGECAVHSNK